MSRTAQALMLRCPECEATPGYPCVYLPVPETTYSTSHAQRDLRAARAALTGTPTQRPHNARFAQIEVQAQKIRRAHRLAVPPPDPAAVALRQFDLVEQEALRTWLRLHGHLLTSAHYPLSLRSTAMTRYDGPHPLAGVSEDVLRAAEEALMAGASLDVEVGVAVIDIDDLVPVAHAVVAAVLTALKDRQDG